MVNAAVDALSPFGVTELEMPLTPAGSAAAECLTPNIHERTAPVCRVRVREESRP